MSSLGRPIEILMVEDNPSDVMLTEQAMAEAKIANNMVVAEDGEKALAILRGEAPYEDSMRPDLILLDLNLPKLGGHEVLREIKKDESLRSIPVVVLTTSEADEDIVKSYDLQANCYVTKPVDFERFAQVVGQVESFWFSIVSLPAQR